MKVRDDIRQLGQGMKPRTAYPTFKYGVGYRVVAETHPSGAYHRGSSTAMGDASSDPVRRFPWSRRVPRAFLWPVAPLLPCGAETSMCVCLSVDLLQLFVPKNLGTPAVESAKNEAV